MARPEAARAYYAALDDGDYDALADLLAPDFVHERPDRTLEGRDRFVRFMREERPLTDTTHAIDAVCGSDSSSGPGSGSGGGGSDGEVVVRGRLLDGDDVLVRFCDAFAFDGGRIAHLVTYTN